MEINSGFSRGSVFIPNKCDGQEQSEEPNPGISHEAIFWSSPARAHSMSVEDLMGMAL